LVIAGKPAQISAASAPYAAPAAAGDDEESV
jgi:hypothetical protein